MPFTLAEALTRIDQLIEEGKPRIVITANLHYAMVSARYPEVRELNRKAGFIVADGWPLVLASRLQKTPVPERVAGADMIYAICRQAAERGRRLFFLGGEPSISAEACRVLRERFPALIIAGAVSPPFRKLTESEERDLVEQIRAARPHILIVAFGQPKGELWIERHRDSLQVPVSIQMGASLDFVAGKVRRAPKLVQKCGLEWAFRFVQEPRRLGGRYFANGLFLIRMLFGHTRRRGRPVA
jgi:N-acetylglucosaminyldiphosphoundecaprenol N-acetyl-beta-D-mannosaminyltransferase